MEAQELVVDADGHVCEPAEFFVVSSFRVFVML